MRNKTEPTFAWNATPVPPRFVALLVDTAAGAAQGERQRSDRRLIDQGI
jgi:hypothetical protein